MLGITIFIFGSALLWFEVVLPLYRAQTLKVDRRFNRAFRYHQLRTVKAFYPSLREKSLKEIEDEYDFREAYHRIGQPSHVDW